MFSRKPTQEESRNNIYESFPVHTNSPQSSSCGQRQRAVLITFDAAIVLSLLVICRLHYAAAIRYN